MWTLAWARVHTYSGKTTCCDWLSGWLAGWLLLPTSRHNMSANGSILRFVFRGSELLKKPIGIPTLRLLCVFFAQAGTEVTNAMRTELENFQRYDFLFALSLRCGCILLPAMSTGGSTLRFASCGFSDGNKRNDKIITLDLFFYREQSILFWSAVNVTMSLFCVSLLRR